MTLTRVVLLEQLKLFTQEAIKDLLLPVEPLTDNDTPPSRTPGVYIPKLPEQALWHSKAPFITHEIVTGRDCFELDPRNLPGALDVKVPRSLAVVRSCFCVYGTDAQQGSHALLNLMERFRIALIQQGIVGGQFELDLHEGLETLVYPTNPEKVARSKFALGEMISNWRLPPVERMNPYGRQQNGCSNLVSGPPSCGQEGAIHNFFSQSLPPKGAHL